MQTQGSLLSRLSLPMPVDILHYGVVVDASILSLTSPGKHDTAEKNWVNCVPREALIVPEVVLRVIDHGIAALRDDRPARFEELCIWRTCLARSGIQVIGETASISAILDNIRRVKPLNGLWMVVRGRRRCDSSTRYKLQRWRSHPGHPSLHSDNADTCRLQGISRCTDAEPDRRAVEVRQSER